MMVNTLIVVIDFVMTDVTSAANAAYSPAESGLYLSVNYSKFKYSKFKYSKFKYSKFKYSKFKNSKFKLSESGV